MNRIAGALNRNRLFSSHKHKHRNQANKALRILDIITNPKRIPINDSKNHLRIIQGFLQADKLQSNKQFLNNGFISSSSLDSVFDGLTESTLVKNDEPDRESGCLRRSAVLLSSAVSECGCKRDIRSGIGYHCLGIVTGLVSNAYVGCSLISLYGRCGDLVGACKVFDEMSNRNVVSWTAIISGFALDLQVDVCLRLFSAMRMMRTAPNDFTFTSLLSACMGIGSVGQGRGVHCQIVRMGFDSYLHVCNSLISMYFKCGSVEDALEVFENMRGRDVVSWNSVIAGYAQNGLAEQAIEVFERMKKQEVDVKPDAITFLGVLSSCQHAGLIQQGRNYLRLMVEYGLRPELDHYSCMVDLLGRAGLLEEARNFIENMPIPPNAVIWGSLLSSCRLRGNVWIGIQAAENRLLLEPTCATTHVQLANLYASVGRWDGVARIRKLMKDGGLRTNPGYSWIEIKNVVHRFKAADGSNTRLGEILASIDSLVSHMETNRWMLHVVDEIMI